MKPQLFHSLKEYKKKDLLGDLIAGLMVAIIALPLSIALGIQSVPAEVSSRGIQFGIITAIVAGFFISAMGGSKHQIGGPTAAFVTILFGYLANPDIGVLGLAIAGMMAGVILIVMGLLKAGNVMKFFPFPITVGFTTGIGVTLLIGQIKDFCGFTASGTEAIEKIVSYIENISTFDLATFGVGTLGLLCVIFLPKLSKKIPAAFVALIVCTGATLLLNNVFNANVATIGSKYGKVEAGFFPIDFSGIGNVKFGALVLPSIVIAFLCAIESLLSATVAANMTGTTFDANQELVGQGVANISSSLLGGLPATGAIARTAASIENGAKSPLAGIFHALFLLVMYFALMGVLQYIPLAVFSAILISVAINMSHFSQFVKLASFGIRDTIVLLLTFALTVIFDLTYGVLGGVAVTFILNIKNIKIGMTASLSEKDEDENGIDDCATLRVHGTLFFLNANKLADKAVEVLQKADKLIIDFTDLERIDETALQKLKGIKTSAIAMGKSVEFIGLNENMTNRFEKFYTVV